MQLQPGILDPAFSSSVNDQLNGTVTEQKGLQKGRTYRASVWVHTLSSGGAQLSVSVTGNLSGGGTVNTTVVRQKDDPSNIRAGNWTLLTVDADVPSNITNGGTISVTLGNPSSYAPISPTGGTLPAVSNTATAYFDDFNLHPVDAPIRGYVRDAKTGWVLAELDNEDFATYYTRDAAGRVIQTDKETYTFNGTRKVNTRVYHNAR